MQVILDTALPFFALIFCGYGAGRFNLLSEASIAGVNAFVYYFALPTFLFNLMATSPLSDVANGPFVAAYLGSGLPVFAVAAVLGRMIFKVRPSEAALQGAAAVLGNTGYMDVFIIARQHDTYVDRTSSAVLLSTIISVITVSSLLSALPFG